MARTWWISALMLLCVGLWCAWRTATWFSGDAVVHMPFAENAARGAWFQYNLGEASGASSSPLMVLLGAALWRAGGVAGYVYGLKLLSLASWIMTACAVLRVARTLGATGSYAWFGAIVATCLPGSVWNWFQGSENGLLAAIVAGQVALLSSASTTERPRWTTSLGLGVSCGLGAMLRPEGIGCAFVTALGYVYALQRRASSKQVAHAALMLTVTALLTLSAYGLQREATGAWLAQSSLSRVMLARRQPFACNLFGFWIYPRAVLRLIAYAPVLVLAGLGLRAAKSAQAHARITGTVIAAQVALGVGAYTLVTGAAHTARYMIWIFALLGMLAAVGLERLLALRTRWAAPVSLLAAGWLGSVTLAEAYARFKDQSAQSYLSQLLRAPLERERRTDALLAQVCGFGCCSVDRKIALAAVRIEVRFDFDERVIIRSMDGVAAAAEGEAMRFRADGCPVVEDLFQDPQVLAFFEHASGKAFYDCAYSGRTGALNAGWITRTTAPEGFRWSAPRTPRILVRDCTNTTAAKSP